MLDEGICIRECGRTERYGKKARRLMHRVELSIRRALKCHGCGVCVGQCPNDVIVIEDGVAVTRDGCVHCGKCIEVCPVVKFG